MRRADVMPFGDAVGAPDSDVFDVHLPKTPVSRKMVVEISFGVPLM
jgi:hypothetical protein